MVWNHLIGEALLACGHRDQAAKLVKHLMKAQTQIMKTHHHFHELYHAETGEPGGEESILSGLPPLGIGSDSVIEGAIVDKNARIGNGVEVRSHEGAPDEDGDGYFVRDGVVIIPKTAVIPDGRVI